VDRLTWKAYEADLERNLEDLHNRVHSGAYRARPSRRVYIPKPDGRQRPLAVAALEDKIVQRAVVALLNAISDRGLDPFERRLEPFTRSGKADPRRPMKQQQPDLCLQRADGVRH
jgi:retron-type reverse transcriptase